MRIGILGASSITPLSLVQPAAATGHRLVAVAARDPRRARAFADEHGVERVHDSYQDVIDDPEVDVVYNPLPNSLHAEWNIKAARAGKHILSEKPSALDAAQAEQVRDVVDVAGVVFMEAFHYPYHPTFLRVCELLGDGAIGVVEHIYGDPADAGPTGLGPSVVAELGGGATMDLGCYSFSCLRLLGRFVGGEPTLVAATAEQRPGRPGVDERLLVDVRYPSGATGAGGSDMSAESRAMALVVRGSRGRDRGADVRGPARGRHGGPSRRPGLEDTVEHLGTRTSYTYQPRPSPRRCAPESPVLTDADWAVGNMRLVDAAYAAAGFDRGRQA